MDHPPPILFTRGATALVASVRCLPVSVSSQAFAVLPWYLLPLKTWSHAARKTEGRNNLMWCWTQAGVERVLDGSNMRSRCATLCVPCPAGMSPCVGSPKGVCDQLGCVCQALAKHLAAPSQVVTLYVNGHGPIWRANAPEVGFTCRASQHVLYKTEMFSLDPSRDSSACLSA
jgi:hypothetical protein